MRELSALGMQRLNRLPDDEARAVLLTCCASPRWAATVAAGRPYASSEELFAAAEVAWWSLDQADWRAAFAAHPRIGERERADRQARREQAGMAGASIQTRAALVEGNRRYEERFGHVFLICASGLGAAELLAALDRRLGNDPDTELRAAAGEQAKITRLRLQVLVS